MNWPAAMKLQTAAAYLDLTVAAFEREVAAGSLPMPFVMDGKDRWRKSDLDRAIDGGDMSEAEREFKRRYG